MSAPGTNSKVVSRLKFWNRNSSKKITFDLFWFSNDFRFLNLFRIDQGPIITDVWIHLIARRKAKITQCLQIRANNSNMHHTRVAIEIMRQVVWPWLRKEEFLLKCNSITFLRVTATSATVEPITTEMKIFYAQF